MTDVAFAEQRVDDHRQALAFGDDLRRFVRAPEIARVDPLERLVDEEFGQRARLLAAPLVQRRIGVSLEATVPVPVGLSVAGEDQGRHPV